MLLTILALAAAIVADPQPSAPTASNTQTVYSVGGGLARFADNDARLIVENERRDQIQRMRQIVIDQRMEVADRLDRMIANGDCGGARDLAVRARYADIREAVSRVCDAREASSAG
ncbi:MAG: hypothetical protein ACK4MY_09735 [Brevundimonas sp.]